MKHRPLAHLAVTEAGRETLTERILKALPPAPSSVRVLDLVTVQDALGLTEPWNTVEVIKKLIEAAEILLHEKDYDGHGWEEIAGCVRYGKERIEKLETLHRAITPNA